MTQETKSPEKKARLAVDIDPQLLRRLRQKRVDTSRPVNEIVEEVLKRHFPDEPSPAA